MELIFVSGVSGAGKSRAMDVLEDLDFYCVDNMPPKLIPVFLDLINNNGDNYKKVAIATDIRGGDFFYEFGNTLSALRENGTAYKIIYMDCSDEVLLKRYKLSRRRHPLMESDDVNILEAVTREKKALTTIRGMADYVIDTTFLEPYQLKERLLSILNTGGAEGMHIYCMSFGFKYGVPTEADLMFDVRCLPNPFYIPELKIKTGKDEDVRSYVMSFSEAETLLEKLCDLVDYLIPYYEKEGKNQLVIAVGCSGGRHRSVVFAEAIAKSLNDKGIKANINHRDIKK